MSLKIQTAKALAVIQADEFLMTCARGSIRYNGSRMQQANDMMSKLHAHNRIEGALGNVKALAGALREIEKQDKAN